VHHQLGKVI